MNLAARPTLEAPDDDPRIWLEDIDGERALAWVDAQTAETVKRFGSARFEADRDTLAALLDRPDKIAMVSRRGAFAYNFWQDAANPRGLWRRASWTSYRAGAPVWETLLDVDALAKAEGEDWIWAGATTLAPAHGRALLKLSRGGGDATVLREFDLAAQVFLAAGFQLAEAKGGAGWVDADTLLVSSALGEGFATRSGYARAVRLWRRDEAFAQAKIVFEVGAESMSASGYLDRTVKPPRFVMAERLSFFEYDLWLGASLGTLARLDLPPDADKELHGDWLLVKPRMDWTVGGSTYVSDALLAIPLSRFLAGAREFTVLFTPAERRALEVFAWIGERLLLSILDDLTPVFERWTPSETGWTRTRLTGLPEIGVIDIWPLDLDEEESNGEALISLQDPLTPASLLVADLSPDIMSAPALLARTPASFDASGLVVTRHEAVSVDGERIPYVQVGPAKADGEALVHMSGYGGFGISEKPYYRTAIGKLWLERGGVGVVANIRGGGEFGTRWHEAGRREKKHLSHDDFAAVAADLVARGVTRPKRIAAEGGSNGGILISNMLTRYPDRFGALFCTIPLIDMRRYAMLLAGASWIDEYGDPDKPEDWAFLKNISAYHTAAPGRPYPPILVATSRRDDRVHPGHARKFALKLQEMGYHAWFYEPPAGGHGYGKDNKERAAFTALGLNFLWENILAG